MCTLMADVEAMPLLHPSRKRTEWSIQWSFYFYKVGEDVLLVWCV